MTHLLRSILGASLVWLAAQSPLLAADGTPTAPGPVDYTLDDYQGQPHSLADLADKPLVVLAFLGTECPLARQYGPQLQKLADEYADRGVAVVGISSNTQDSVTELASYARRHEIKYPILKDLNNVLADRVSATRTPEVFLLDAGRAVIYRGRVDDRFVVGISRGEATREDLRAAIDEALAGHAITVARTEPLGCLIGRVRQPKEDSEVTYSNQIARVFNEHCVSCHREGEIGPFVLESYEDAAGWGEMIAEVVENRRMPPWHADPEIGHFANDRSLSSEERELIATWVKNGCPEGDPSQLPEPPTYTTGWQLSREPDQVFAMAEAPFHVPADGGRNGVRYQYFETPTNLTEDKWFYASEVRPGTPEVIHHIIVFCRTEPNQKRQDWIFLNAYVPGLRLHALPKGAAKRIPAGSSFIFEVHYTPNGVTHEDISEVGFLYADPEDVTHEVITTEAANGNLNIKPYDANQEFSARSGASPVDLTLLSMSPHMHVRGKSFKYEAVFPDGSRETLLDVPHYDFNWQTRYVLEEPRVMPAGARMECTAVFDNSEENLANPDPSQTVRWGDQSWEEMLIGYFDVMVPKRVEGTGKRPLRTQVDLEQMVRRMDKDNNGVLTKEETKDNPLISFAFDKIDTSGDSLLQEDELRAAAAKLKKQLGE